MIISDGELIPDGSGGNYYIAFTNEGYSYQVWRNYLTDYGKKAPYTLIVNDPNDREILSQDGYVVKNKLNNAEKIKSCTVVYRVSFFMFRTV
ncbi:hypothetical protein EJ377_16995 [Chryseobacterium arthrosphaerae]|uniref:Uncharacterized protein n=1 Tax=Chryseobacterium arthrosphaerae TaxID=651561 RepID=A0A432DSM9_9FLAO|nr:hypothetical protein EJ377_16995 [Chryseobacterium arthrosphaerae]